jgi:hypothetical protein
MTSRLGGKFKIKGEMGNNGYTTINTVRREGYVLFMSFVAFLYINCNV